MLQSVLGRLRRSIWILSQGLLRLGCALSLSLSLSLAVVLGPVRQAYAEVSAEILYFLGGPQQRLAVIKMPDPHGLVAGSKLRAFRREGGPLGGEITTGYLQVESVEEGGCLAKVSDDGTALSRAAFAAYPGLMAGDQVTPLAYLVKKVQVALPSLELSYLQLFREPKALPHTYELSEKGMLALKEAVAIIHNKRLSLIFIKAYTDHEGPSAQNQVESYQRALAVKHFLVTELGFDAERLVAIGMGESSPRQNLAGLPANLLDERRLVIEVSQNP